jgi:hypothetical protein
MPARNPEAVCQRAVAAANQPGGGQPAAPPLDPVFVALNPGQLPARRDPHGGQGMRLRRAEEIETLSYRTVVELNAESGLPRSGEWSPSLVAPNAPKLASERPGRADRRQLGRMARADRSERSAARREERGW